MLYPSTDQELFGITVMISSEMIEFGDFREEASKTASVINSCVYSPPNSTTSPDWLLHKHRNNPDGVSTYFLMKENEEPTAHICVQKRLMANSENVEFAYNPNDLVSLSSRPMASLLLYRAVAKYVQTLNVTTYHSSNPKSDFFYSKILKKEQVGKLEMKAAILSLPKTHRLSKFNFLLLLFWKLQRASLAIFYKNSAVEIVSVEEFSSEDLEDLDFTSSDLFLKRDATRLNWRFSNHNPERQYSRFLVSLNGRVVGYFITTKVVFDEITGIAIVDFYFSKMTPVVRSKVIRHLLTLSNESNVVFCICNTESNLAKSLFGFPFIRVPQRLQPQTFPIYLMSSNANPFKSLKTFMTLFDLDIL